MHRIGNTIRADEGDSKRFGILPEDSVENVMQTEGVYSEIIPGLEQSAQTLMDSEDPQDQLVGQKRLGRVTELQHFVHAVHQMCQAEYDQRNGQATR